MKQIKIAIFVLFFIQGMFLSLSAQKHAFISGKLAGENVAGVTISASDPLAMQVAPVNAVTASDGSFRFELPVDGLTLTKLSLVSDKYIYVFMKPGDKIELVLDAVRPGRKPGIRGSDDTRILYEIAAVSAGYEAKMDSLSRLFNELKTDPAQNSRLYAIQVVYAKESEDKRQALRSLLLKNASSPACLLMMDKLDVSADFDVYDSVSRAVNCIYPDFKLASDLEKTTSAERKLAVGSVAPEITLPSPDGIELSLSSLRGKIVLIDFWAAWCGPCRRENPEVVRMYNRFKDKGFEIFGVSLDRDREAWLKAIEKDGLVWTQVSDLKYWQSKAAVEYGVKSIPHTVLLDREGRVIARRLRGPALEQKLEELMPE